MWDSMRMGDEGGEEKGVKRGGQEGHQLLTMRRRVGELVRVTHPYT